MVLSIAHSMNCDSLGHDTAVALTIVIIVIKCNIIIGQVWRPISWTHTSFSKAKWLLSSPIVQHTLLQCMETMTPRHGHHTTAIATTERAPPVNFNAKFT